MTALLASARNLTEASTAFEGGADIIDLKEPAFGALGAVPRDEVKRIIDALHPKDATISCTIGDLPCNSAEVPVAIRDLLALGADIVKFGVFETVGYEHLLAVLRPTILKGGRLVAVILVDRIQNALELIEPARVAGLYGVMLDTADKARGSLRSLMADSALHEFVNAAHSQGLRAGLAGSLRLEDVGSVLAVAPDYIGFRGALCTGSLRNESLDPESLRKVRAMIPRKFAMETRYELATEAGG